MLRWKWRRVALLTLVAVLCSAIGASFPRLARVLAGRAPAPALADLDWTATRAAAEKLRWLDESVADLVRLQGEPGGTYLWRETLQTGLTALQGLVGSVRAEWTQVGTVLARGGAPQSVRQRHRDAADLVNRRLESVLLKLTEAVQAPAAPAAWATGNEPLPPAVAELHQWLQGWAAPAPGPVANDYLPFGPGQGVPALNPAPDPGPPARLPLSTGAPGPDDLAPEYTGLEADLSPVLQETGSSLAAIAAWVYREVTLQWYEGRLKHPAAVLAERQGNDTDIAGVLLALLRQAGIPARYGHGQMLLSAADWPGLTGLTDADAVTAFLSAAGLQVSRLIDQRLAVAHTWVEAWDQSRGRWVAIDAAWKPQTFPAVTAAATAPDFDLNRYLVTARNVSPVTYALGDTTEISAAVRSVSQALPAGTLPELRPAVAGQGLVWLTWPQERTGQFTVNIAGADLTLPTPAVHGRRLTVSFVPATEADRFAEGLFADRAAPPYLGEVRAVVRLDGRAVAEGTPVPAGSVQDLRLSWRIGFQQETVQRQWLAGDTHSILFFGRPPEPADLDARAAALLHTPPRSVDDLYGLQLAALQLDYLQRIERAGARLSTAWGQRMSQGQRLGLAGFAAEFEHLLGVPFAAPGLRLAFDAARVAATPVAVAGAKEIDTLFWVTLAAEASYQEQQSVTATYGIPAQSTVSNLTTRLDRGENLAWVCRLNGDRELLRIDFSAAAQEHMQTAFGQNLFVVAPHGGGTAESYIIIDPRTGASGYFLSAGRNGALSERLNVKDHMWAVDVAALPMLTGHHPLSFMLPAAALWKERVAVARALTVGSIDGLWAGAEGEWEGLKQIPKTLDFLWRFSRDREFRKKFMDQARATLEQLSAFAAEFTGNWQEYLAAAAESLVAKITAISGLEPGDPGYIMWLSYYPVGWLLGMGAEMAAVTLASAGIAKLVTSIPEVQRLVQTLTFLVRNFLRLSGPCIRALLVLDRLFPDVEMLKLMDWASDPRIRRYLERTLVKSVEAVDLKGEVSAVRQKLAMLAELAESVAVSAVQDDAYLAAKRVWEAAGLSARDSEILRILRPQQIDQEELRAIAIAMRLAIPNPAPGKRMRKFLTIQQAREYIEGRFANGSERPKDLIMGYFTDSEYSEFVRTPDDVAQMMRMNYPGGLDQQPNEVVFWIDFEYVPHPDHGFDIPFAPELGGQTRDGWPFSGTGWISTKGRWIPEYRFRRDSGHRIPRGTPMMGMTADGRKFVHKMFDGENWVDP